MFDSNNTQSSASNNLPIKETFLSLCDQYSEFNDDCAFFCTAASLIMQSDAMELNKASAQGAARFAQRLIEQSQGLNDQLQQMLHNT